ncbi:MAG: hypothetical protein IKW28_08125 [Lachnospiraceae bacterium]|nr:hypothetical protein [Lachnospiraceae bacterium]
MNCKDSDKMIPLFLTDQLRNKDLYKFLNHVNKCEECMEELTIQYLVMIGSSILEEGKSFDLREALNLLLADANKRIKRWRVLYALSYVAEALTIAAVVIILMMVVL